MFCRQLNADAASQQALHKKGCERKRLMTASASWLPLFACSSCVVWLLSSSMFGVCAPDLCAFSQLIREMSRCSQQPSYDPVPFCWGTVSRDGEEVAISPASWGCWASLIAGPIAVRTVAAISQPEPQHPLPSRSRRSHGTDSRGGSAVLLIV